MFSNVSDTEHSYQFSGIEARCSTPGEPSQHVSHRQFRITMQVVFQATLSSAP